MRMTCTPVIASPAMMRALDRRRAAPARQQRRMQIEAAELRRIEHGLGKNKPIRNHNRRIELKRRERLLLFRALQAFRRTHL